ncbi:MAG: PIN domain-containing protein [Spirochaetota bacterium]
MPPKVFLDTSVLVAALVKSHPSHNRAYPYFHAIFHGEQKGLLSTHVLAELYAVLTVLPIKPKLSSLEVEKLLEINIFPKFTIIPLETQHYQKAIQQVSLLHESGGIIYDALHIEAALQGKADELVTFNFKHFETLAQQKLKVKGI